MSTDKNEISVKMSNSFCQYEKFFKLRKMSGETFDFALKNRYNM